MEEFDPERERMAIRHLLSVYATAGERGKIDEIMELWGDECVFEVPQGVFRGKEEIKAALGGIAHGESPIDVRGSKIHLTTSRIEFDDLNGARGWTHYMVICGSQILQTGDYIDRFQRISRRWKIIARRCKTHTC